MRAAVYTYGPPDVVRIAEVDKPPVTDQEVLVKVHVTTVNRTDCGFRAAKPFFVRVFSGLLRPKATVLGCEFAGVVEAMASGVTSFEVGNKVFGFNEWRFGAHAEYLSMPEDGSLATMPATVTYEEAAPSTEGSTSRLPRTSRARSRRLDSIGGLLGSRAPSQSRNEDGR